MSNATQDRTFLTFVLDETGSMSTIKDDTIGGFNEYLSRLQQSGEPIDFTLIKFDSNRHEIPYRAVDIHDVKPLDAESYQPGACTPLIDAVVKAIKATEAKAGESQKVIIAVQTDGYENASTEFKNEDLVRLVKEKTAAGWLFTFLGAGIDAFEQAGRFGFTAANTMSYGRDRSRAAFAAVAGSNMRYTSAGGGIRGQSVAAYTQSERMTSGDTFHGKHQQTVTAGDEEPKSVVDDITI